MKRTKLVIASILKPVNDTRMYEKFALSISQAKKYDVNIIGFFTKNIPTTPNISFHPVFKFDRISIKRLLSPFTFLQKLRQIRPETIIITTHELIIPSVWYKLFNRVRLIYDVRENYYLNIKCLDAFPKIIRDVIAGYVRFKEYLFAVFIDHYLLAEKCYSQELSFTKNKYTIIENKAKNEGLVTSKIQDKKRDTFELLFTGTISLSTGILECIAMAKNLHKIDSKLRLKIVGFCPSESTYKLVKDQIENEAFITLIGGSELVDHDTINRHIKSADFGLVYYAPNRANDGCIPTKIYEYLGANLPIITENKESYYRLLSVYGAALFIDFSQPNYQSLIKDLRTTGFYQKTPGMEVYWKSEEAKLLDLINS